MKDQWQVTIRPRRMAENGTPESRPCSGGEFRAPHERSAADLPHGWEAQHVQVSLALAWEEHFIYNALTTIRHRKPL